MQCWARNSPLLQQAHGVEEYQFSSPTVAGYIADKMPSLTCVYNVAVRDGRVKNPMELKIPEVDYHASLGIWRACIPKHEGWPSVWSDRQGEFKDGLDIGMQWNRSGVPEMCARNVDQTDRNWITAEWCRTWRPGKLLVR
jgi:hypothetical protein